MKSFREKAFGLFEQIGLPTRGNEAFEYLPLSQLPPLPFPESDDQPLLKNLPKEAVCLPLQVALRTYGSLLQNRFNRHLEEEKDPFALLNFAQHQAAYFVYIPPHTRTELPVAYFQGSGQLRLHLFIGAHAEISWINETECASGFCNHFFDVTLEEGAKLHLTQLFIGNLQNWQFETLRATLKKDSRLNLFSLTNGAKSLRQDYRISLIGEGANASLQGLWSLNSGYQAHTHVLMDHVAPHTQSTQCFKGVYKERSQGSFQGKILVRKEAQKTGAYQLNNNLLLGDHAIANSKPNLEIFADDVKASHGATTRQIDSAQLFYLKTRGISEEIAKSMLTRAFCAQILHQIPHLALREKFTPFLP